MKNLRDILILLAVISALVLIGLKAPRRTVIKTGYLPPDTIVIWDTVREQVLVPQVVYVTRTDTVFLDSVADTAQSEVLVPIERRVYETADYRATIEGFRPALVDMEIYRQTQYITKPEIRYEKTKPRWGVGIQAGCGLSRAGISPYIGIGVQYNIFSW